MENNPLYLSVVLSTYNNEKYIAKAIQSILNQTYPYFEFIIVNDGSTDKTLDIIKTFDDPRIVLIDKQNSGLIDSLNIGVRNAKYNWIARMDGDDISESDRFEKQIPFLKENVAVVGAQCSIINESGKIIGHTHFPTIPLLVRLFIKIAFILPIAHPVSIFNKQKWNSVGGYDPNMYLGEDADLWMKMLSTGKFVVLKERLLRYRKYDGNISKNFGELQFANQWLRVFKGSHGINKTLNKQEYEYYSQLVKRVKLYKHHIRGNKFFSFLFCLHRYFVLKRIKI